MSFSHILFSSYIFWQIAKGGSYSLHQWSHAPRVDLPPHPLHRQFSSALHATGVMHYTTMLLGEGILPITSTPYSLGMFAIHLTLAL